MDVEDKIELIATTARGLAELLKDPTKGGTVQMTSELRNEAREELYEDLCVCIDTLASGAEFHHGIFAVISIANKRLNEQEKKED